MYMYGTFDDSQFIHHSVEDLEHSEHSHWNGSKFQKFGFNQFWKKKQISYIKENVRFQCWVVLHAQYPHIPVVIYMHHKSSVLLTSYALLQIDILKWYEIVLN